MLWLLLLTMSSMVSSQFSRSELQAMSKKDLRRLLDAKDIGCPGCTDKDDLVERLLETMDASDSPVVTGSRKVAKTSSMAKHEVLIQFCMS